MNPGTFVNVTESAPFMLGVSVLAAITLVLFAFGVIGHNRSSNAVWLLRGGVVAAGVLMVTALFGAMADHSGRLSHADEVRSWLEAEYGVQLSQDATRDGVPLGAPTLAHDRDGAPVVVVLTGSDGQLHLSLFVLQD